MRKQAQKVQVAYLLRVLRCASLESNNRTTHVTQLYISQRKLQEVPELPTEKMDDPSLLQQTLPENCEGSPQSSSMNPSRRDRRSSGGSGQKG